MAKAPDAFRTISEAAEEVGVPQHVLRHWEDAFSAIKPMRRAGGRRFYRREDLDLLVGVRQFLHDDGFTTKGVQKIFADKGAGYVAKVGRALRDGTADTEATAAQTAAPAPSAAAKLQINRADLEALQASLSSLRSQLAQLKSLAVGPAQR